MPLEVANDILDNQDSEDNTDEYGAAIPQEPHMLHADGDVYDLRDPDQADSLQEKVQSDREALRNGNLSEYEGYSTKYGGGGRARLLYDEVRSDLAQEYHEDKHDMDFADQHKEAMEVVRIVAIKNRGKQK